jgi:hypothetical protein
MYPMIDLKSLKPFDLWGFVEDALVEKGHPWRVFTLSTVDDAGLPHSRSVVLREVESQNWLLRFYSDSRSPKILQLQHNRNVSLCFWNPQLKMQLRAEGLAALMSDTKAINVRWDRVKEGPTVADYTTKLAPGSEVDPLVEFVEQNWFCVVEIQISSFDLLQLNREGHQRVAVTPDGVTALVP